MVMAQSLCIDLKQQFPDAQIDILAPRWSAAIISRMPQVRRLIETDFAHGKLNIKARWQLGRDLRAKQYTQAIVLPNSLKSALVPAIAKIPRRTGFLGEQRWGLLNDIRRLDKAQLPMTVQRFVALGRTQGSDTSNLPAPKLEADQTTAKEIATEFGLNLESPVLALCPGAEFGSSKQWPVQHYAEAAQHFIARGWQVWLLGSAKDQPACESINQTLNGSAHVLAGQTSLTQALDLLALSSLVISNDSGLMHIAAGLNTPLIAVYGSTDPGHTPPLSHNHRIAQHRIECAPCFKRDCPLEHHDCMVQLKADQVIALANELVQ